MATALRLRQDVAEHIDLYCYIYKVVARALGSDYALASSSAFYYTSSTVAAEVFTGAPAPVVPTPLLSGILWEDAIGEVFVNLVVNSDLFLLLGLSVAFSLVVTAILVVVVRDLVGITAVALVSIAAFLHSSNDWDDDCRTP